jgi:hypothetical protein
VEVAERVVADRADVVLRLNSRSASRCSTVNTTARYEVSVYGEGRNRTGDTTVFSRVLYRLSYLAARDSVAALEQPAIRRRDRPGGRGIHRSPREQ